VSTTTSQGKKGTALAQGGKYLTFRLAQEEYGLEILKVQEIIGIMPVTRVPKMPSFVRGIVNLRGKLIPVLDMREKFGLPRQDDTEKTCFIVVQVKSVDQTLVIGVIVDNVSEVLNVQDSQIEAAPSIGTQMDTDFILGIGKIGDRVVILLDIDKVVTQLETKELLAAHTAVNNSTNNTNVVSKAS